MLILYCYVATKDYWYQTHVREGTDRGEEEGNDGGKRWKEKMKEGE